MKNKKGFTLVELLGVIVILAILAIVAIPVVLNIIEESRKGTFRSSVFGLIQATEDYFAKANVREEEIVYTIDPVNSNLLDYKGEKPDSGVIKLNEDGDIALAIKKGKYCAKKQFNEKEPIVTKTDNCTLAS